MITCPSCGKENRREAKYCRYCRADLSPTRTMPSTLSEQDQPSRKGTSIVAGLVRAVKQWTRGAESLPLPSSEPSPNTTRLLPISEPAGTQPAPQAQPVAPVERRVAGRLVSLRRGSILSHPENPRKGYGIVTARELEHSIYYDALNLACPACGTEHGGVPPDGLCTDCQASLPVVLIHERRSLAKDSLSDTEVRRLVRFSVEQADILHHRDIIQFEERTYTAVEHPGRWGVLVRGRRQRSPDEALAGAVQVGRALAPLHHNGFSYSTTGAPSLEGLVVTEGGTGIRMADLSICASLPANLPEARKTLISRDIVFLGKLLFCLATGEELERSDISLAPSALRPVIEHAMHDEYASVGDMLTDLSFLPPSSSRARPLRPSYGQATHPGQQHTRNEDAVVTLTFDKQQEGQSVPIGFYLVADGMGGHDAGDVASRTANEIVTDWVVNAKVLPDLRRATRRLTSDDVPGDLLTRAVQEANQVLIRRGRAKGSDLGSTVTAVLMIGDVATIASVGDSRTYLLRGQRLEQLTQDHSLVARLVEANVITPEEVRSHPQRNQIYRSLGHDKTVEVDTLTTQLQADDILLLCSDGLWEMVPDDEIQRIVQGARNPQQACDELIDAANRAGGDDNIAVIVVEMQ